MDKRFGIIGCGLIGQKRASALSGMGEIVFSCDIDISLAHSIDASFKLDEWRRAIDNHKIDALFVSTHHAALAEITEYAMRKGIAVLVEKPASVNAKELAKLKEIPGCDRVRVGYNHRFHPSIMKLKEMIASNVWGKLLFVRGLYGHGGRIGYEKEWRFDRNLSGGGELLDQGAHLIDILFWVFGTDFHAEHAMITNSFWTGSVEDTAFLSLRHRDSNAPVHLSVSWCEWKNIFRLEVMLERGKIQIDGLGRSYGIEKLSLFQMKPEMGPPDVIVENFNECDQSFQIETFAFLKSVGLSEVSEGPTGILAHENVGATLEDAFNTMELIDELYRRFS